MCEMVSDASSTHEATAKGLGHFHLAQGIRVVASVISVTCAPMSRVLIFPRSSILYIHPSLLGHRDSNPLGGCQECVKMFSATILLLLGLTFFLPAVSQCVLLSRASYAYCPVLPSPYHCQSTATLRRGSTRNCQKNPESSRRSSNLY